MNSRRVLEIAGEQLHAMNGHVFDVLSITKPVSIKVAVNLAKVISKLSPLLGNLIELNIIEILNEKTEFARFGEWRRQDPGFPDAIFIGDITPVPGFEIKAWFPLATEITARFKDSQRRFIDDNIDVAMLAWLPEYLIFGRPKILAVCVVSGKSVAKARDDHYHKPPDYIVFEPGDTRARTKNLQQTNTSGYKFQGTRKEFTRAKRMVAAWGSGGEKYSPLESYQAKLRQLFGKFNYKLDTNYAKMDRIVHPDIETFKDIVMAMRIHGMAISEWSTILASHNDAIISDAFKSKFDIRDQAASKLVH